jgi:hypothetical protein
VTLLYLVGCNVDGTESNIKFLPRDLFLGLFMKLEVLYLSKKPFSKLHQTFYQTKKKLKTEIKVYFKIKK